VEFKLEKLVEIIVSEVVKELSQKGFRIMNENEQKINSCSCKSGEVNPSNCKTSDLSEKYLSGIKTDINDCLAL
jgi:hypothetical protein